jgi:uncharacterized membrane protein (UPF0127 family)
MDFGMTFSSNSAKLSAMKIFVSFALLCLCIACREELTSPRSTAASSAPATNSAMPKTSEPPSPTQAQPRLRTIKLWLGTNELTTEVAATFNEVQTGMMWRTNMAEMDGMIFVFARPFQATFWMKNTLLPLSCAYIASDGTILELHDMKPRDESSIPSKTDQVQYVLEVNQGWFQRHNVTEGMLVKSDRGTLQETFFRR